MKSTLFSLFSFFFLSFVAGAQALTLYVQTPTAAGAPALVVWTRDSGVDGAGELRFDLRFVSTGNSTASNTTTTASSSSNSTSNPSITTQANSTTTSTTTTQDNSFVVQARADADSSAASSGTDAGLALANIRLGAGVNSGSADVFFPAGGSYFVTAVSGPNNTPIGTSNAITVTDSPSAAAPATTNAPSTASATPSSSAPTPTTAPALTTVTPSATPSLTVTGGPVSAAASPSSRKHANLPAIIGGVLGTLVALALLATIVFLIGRRRQLREKRRMTFHREWMVQSSESVRNLNLQRATSGAGAGGSTSDIGHAMMESDNGHGGASLSRTPSNASSVTAAARAYTNTAGLLVPPSPFICVTPPPEDLETGLARNTVASRTPKKLRLHMYTNDTDPVSPTGTTFPAGAAPPATYTPTMLMNARNVAASLSANGSTAEPPMRQTSTTPVTSLARASSIHAHPGASPMGPRAPSPSPAGATNGTSVNVTTTPTSPFPPQLPPLNLDMGGLDGARKPPASAPARSITFPSVKPSTTRAEPAGVGRSATTTAAGVINTLATRPASPRLPTSTSAPAPAPLAMPVPIVAPTPIPAPTPVRSSGGNRKTPRQHLLAARLAILQNQMAEILSAPDSVHSNFVLADMRRQVAWLAEHENGDWAMGRTDERPAGWARVMTP